MFKQLTCKPKVERLYRNLTQKKTLDYFDEQNHLGLSDQEKMDIIERLKNKTFQFKDDKASHLVYLIVRDLVATIYADQPYVSRDKSFVLIKRYFKSAKWIALKTYDDKPISLERISDPTFIDLLNKLKKHGHHTRFLEWLTYLDDDCKDSRLKQDYDTGDKRQPNPEYRRLASRLQRARERYRNGLCEKSDLVAIKKQLYQQPIGLPVDPSFKRLVRVRVGKTVIYGLIGPKEDAKRFGKVYHNTKLVPWLGTYISWRSRPVTKKYGNKRGRYTHGSVRFYIDINDLRSELKQFEVRDSLTPQTITRYIHRPDAVMLTDVNQLLWHLYRRYQRCSNVSLLSSVKYVLEYSFYNTMARKYDTSIAKYKTKHYRNGQLTVDGVPLVSIAFKVYKADA